MGRRHLGRRQELLRRHDRPVLDRRPRRLRRARATTAADSSKSTPAISSTGPNRFRIDDETPPQDQDPRHPGPGLVHAGAHPRPVRRRRRRLPHQYEPHLSHRAGRAARRRAGAGSRGRPADRHPGRPAGPQDPAGHAARRLAHPQGGRAGALRAQGPGRRSERHSRFRIPKSSPR